MSKELRPGRGVMSLIGQEIIAGFKGGQSINLGSLRFGPKGGVAVRTKGEYYPRGIYAQRQPDGENYKDLSKATVRFKKEDNMIRPNTALYGLGKLVNGLMFTVNNDNSGVRVHFATSELNTKSLKMEKGTWFMSKKMTHGNRPGEYKKVYTPPRKHRDVQPMVVEKIHGIMNAWAKRFKGKSI